MPTHGLPGAAPGDGEPSPLPSEAAALRVDLREYRITAVNDALTELVGRAADEVVGLPLADLWPPAERTDLARRAENAVLLGHERLGRVALPTARGTSVWVDVEARFLYRGGQRLELVLMPAAGAQDAPPPGAETLSGAEPAQGSEVSLALQRPVGSEAPLGASTSPGSEPSPELAPLVGPEAPVGAIASPESEPSPGGAPSAGGEPPAEVEATPGAEGAREGEPGPPATPGPAAPNEVDGPMPDDASATLVLAALEAADAGGLWVGGDGRVIGATRGAERLLGAAVASIRGRPLDEVVTLADAAAAALAVARDGRMRQGVRGEAAASGTAMVLDWVPGHGPGAGFVVLSAGTAAADSGETDRLRFQAQLASHVAHDLRDSMAAVFCGLQLLADEFPPGDPRRRTVDQALDDSRRANRIIDEVLAISRPGRLKRIELDLGEVVAGTVSRYRLRAAARSVEVREQIAPDLVISADRSALERAFGNIIDNALQATPHLGVLTITVVPETRAGPGARVSIADTGTGIPRSIQPNIFEPFVTNRDGGSGLGLAITRRIVIDHGGQIDFESEEGRGTTFHIWLPRPA
jgi:PAS domain S-box-containing protein